MKSIETISKFKKQFKSEKRNLLKEIVCNKLIVTGEKRYENRWKTAMKNKNETRNGTRNDKEVSNLVF